MSTWVVTNRSTGEVVYAYQSEEPVEYPGMEFAMFNHAREIPVVVEPVDDSKWRIYVGAFFDRFGASRLGILSSTDTLIQAAVKDCSVRKYIDLKARRDDLAQMLTYVASQGYPLDISSILDTEPTEPEIWQPSIA